MSDEFSTGEWFLSEVIAIDEDGPEPEVALDLMHRRRLFGIFGFYVVKDERSVRIVGRDDTFEKFAFRMRTHDWQKVYKRLFKSNGAIDYIMRPKRR